MHWNNLPLVLATKANVAVLGQFGLRRSEEGRWQPPADFEAELEHQMPRHEDALAGLSVAQLQKRLSKVLRTVERVWPAGNESQLELALFRGPRLAGSVTKKTPPCLALHIDLVAGREAALATEALTKAEIDMLLELAVVHEVLHIAHPDLAEAEVLGEQRQWLEGLEEERLDALKRALHKVEHRRAGSRPFLGYVEACTARPVMEPLVDFAVGRAVGAAEPLGCRYSKERWGDELTLGPYLAAKLHPGYSKLLAIRKPGDVIGGLWTLPASVISTLMLFAHALFKYRAERATQRDSSTPVGQTLAEMRVRRMLPPFKVTTSVLTVIGIIGGVLFFFSEPLLPLIPNSGNGLLRTLGLAMTTAREELVARRDVGRVASYLPEGWNECVAELSSDEPAHHGACQANRALPSEDEALLRDLLDELRDAPSAQERRKAVRLASALLSAPTTATGRRAAVEALRGGLLSARTRPVAIDELQWLLGLEPEGEDIPLEPAAAADDETGARVAKLLFDTAANGEDRSLLADLGPLVARLLGRAESNQRRLRALEVVGRLPIQDWQDTVKSWVSSLDPDQNLDDVERTLLDLAGELALRSGAAERRFAAVLVKELLRLESGQNDEHGTPNSKRTLAILEQLLQDSGVRSEAASHLQELVKFTPSNTPWTRDLVRILAGDSHGALDGVLNETLDTWSDPGLYADVYETALTLVDSRRSGERSAGLARLRDLARQGDRATRARVFQELANQISSSNPEPAIRMLRSLLRDPDLRSRIQGQEELSAIAQALTGPGTPGATLETELPRLVATIREPRGLEILAPGLVAAARQQVDGGMSILDALLARSQELGTTFETREAIVAPFLHYLVDQATRLESAHGALAKARLLEISSDSAVRAVLPVLFDESVERQNLAAEILREILPCPWSCFQDPCIGRTTRRWVLETMERRLAERPDGVPARTLVEHLLPCIALDFTREGENQVVKVLLTLVRESPDLRIRERAIEVLGGTMTRRRTSHEAENVLRSMVLGNGEPAPERIRTAALGVLLDQAQLRGASVSDLLSLVGSEPTEEDWSIHVSAWEDRRLGSRLFEDLHWGWERSEDYLSGLLLRAGFLSELPRSLRPLIFAGHPFLDLPETSWIGWFGCDTGEEPRLAWEELVVPWLTHPKERVRNLGRVVVDSCVDPAFLVAMGFEKGETDRFDSGWRHPLLLGVLAGSGLAVPDEDPERSQLGEAVWTAAVKEKWPQATSGAAEEAVSDLARLKRSFLKTFDAGWELAHLVGNPSPEPELTRGLSTLRETTSRELVELDGRYRDVPEWWHLQEWAEARFLAAALAARYTLAQPTTERTAAVLDGAMALLRSPGLGRDFLDIESLLLHEIPSALAGLVQEDPDTAADQVEKLFGLYLDHAAGRPGPLDHPSRWPEAYLEAAIEGYELVSRSAPSVALRIPGNENLFDSWRGANGPQILRRLLRLAFEMEDPSLLNLAGAILHGLRVESWREERVVSEVLLRVFDTMLRSTQKLRPSTDARPRDPAFVGAREQLAAAAARSIFWSQELDDLLARGFENSRNFRDQELGQRMLESVVDALEECPLGELPQTRRVLVEDLLLSRLPTPGDPPRLTSFTTRELVELLGKVGHLRRGTVRRSTREDRYPVDDYIRAVVAMYHAGEPLTQLRGLFQEIEQGGDWRSGLLEEAMEDHEREKGWLAALKRGGEAAQRACADLLGQNLVHGVTLEIARPKMQGLLPPACNVLAEEPMFCPGFGDGDDPLRVPAECVVQLGTEPERHCGRQLLWWLAHRCDFAVEEGLQGHPDLASVVEMIETAIAETEPSSSSRRGVESFLRHLSDSEVLSLEEWSRLYGTLQP